MNATMAVSVRVLPHGAGLPLPAYQTAGAAGMDLLAALAPGETMALAPGARGLVPTGIALEIPPGCEAQVRPRSGLAFETGVTVLNAPGTIDSDYRGEIGVLLINLGEAPFEVARGARIAQLVFAPVARAALVEAPDLTATARGIAGFGSTGALTDEGENGR